MNAFRKATVSLVMIVKNEEAQLAECLTPVAQLFDEIIVVDTGSQDATKQIAANLGAQVFDFHWCDDFSAARNECLRHATGDWVFWLDADDRLSGENLVKLQSLLLSLDDSRRVYLMDTVCWSEFVSDGYTLISHPRLFRRAENVRWAGRVHEQLRLPGGAAPIDALLSDIRIDHLGYQDRATQQRKLQRNVRLLRMDYALNPDDESTLVHLGMAYFHLGRWKEAEACFGRLIGAAEQGRDHLRQVYASLGQIALKQGQVTRALAVLQEGLAAFPDDEYLEFLLAECYYEIDDFAAARDALVGLMQRPQRTTYHGGVPGDVKEYLAPRRLADVLRLLRDFAGAESLCRSLLTTRPHDTHVWHTLGRVYLDSHRGHDLLSVVEQMRNCPEGEVFGRLLLALWHLTTRNFAEAGNQIDWLIGQAPHMPLPRLLRVELLTQSRAPIAERIRACRDVLRMQPGNQEVRRVLESLEAAPQTVSRPNQWPTLALDGAPVGSAPVGGASTGGATLAQ